MGSALGIFGLVSSSLGDDVGPKSTICGRIPKIFRALAQPRGLPCCCDTVRATLLCFRGVFGRRGRTAAIVSREYPVVISKYISGAKEVELDAVGQQAASHEVPAQPGPGGAWGGPRPGPRSIGTAFRPGRSILRPYLEGL